MISLPVLGRQKFLTSIQVPLSESAKPTRSSISVQQQHARAQSTSENYGYSSYDPVGEELKRLEVHVSTVEVPLTEQPNLIEITGQKVDAPVPTVQQRRYSAEWDPIRWVLYVFQDFNPLTKDQ